MGDWVFDWCYCFFIMRIEFISVIAHLPFIIIPSCSHTVHIHAFVVTTTLIRIVCKSHASIVCILNAYCFIVKHLFTKFIKAFWRKIFQLKVWSLVKFKIPDRLVKLISMIQVKNIIFIIYRKHSLRIKVDNIEVRVFILITCNWSYNKAHENWFMEIDVSDNVVLFLMVMSSHLPSNYVLKSVKNCMQSATKLTSTLINVRYMSKNNCLSSFLF